MVARRLFELPPLPPPGRRRHWGRLGGAAAALALAEAAAGHPGLCLVVTDSARAAAALEEELRFFTADADLPVLHFPDWETLPYDPFSPHEEIVSERLSILARLPGLARGILVVPTPTLMQRLPPVDYVAARAFHWRRGERLDLEGLRAHLEANGYRAVETVYQHGEYAVRGGLVDVFPMGAREPVRIELFDERIDSLRIFDPETQRSAGTTEEVRILPAREYPLDRAGIKTFLDHWHLRFDVDPRRCDLYREVAAGRPVAGLEYYLPLFFPATATLLDYLPAAGVAFTVGDVHGAAEQFWREVGERYRELGPDPRRPLLPPGELYLDAGELFAQLGRHGRVALTGEPAPPGESSWNAPTLPAEIPTADPRAANPLAPFAQRLAAEGGRTLIAAESPGRLEALQTLLARAGLEPQTVAGWAEFAAGEMPVAVAVYPLERGFALAAPRLRLVTEAELFGGRVMQRRRRNRTAPEMELAIRHLTELSPGAPVVHADHGVGRYRGLVTLEVDGVAQEFVALEYAEGAKLYVPVDQLHLLSRYSAGEGIAAPLHRLGGEQWARTRRRAAERIRDTAAELLAVYARRAARPGYAFPDPGADYERFCAEFPFEETPDQLDAIEAVRRDLLSPHPMDRLVCGDVGFGKTEVAMRAAFIAVAAGRQVLVLVPTTLLARQHFENFRDRFANWPVTVDVVSRLRSAAESRDVLERFQAGRIDILIGTHKLLDGRFTGRDLGLLIIDEEHRFGVRQKERIKALRAEIDVLTLTATPIPRTLHMALGGLRDLSIIATPPARRLAVRTFVRVRDGRTVREAVLRELMRGGQVFYLHNDVRTIERASRELGQLVPEARIAVAHGQMRERELERVMADFYHQRFNVLVCTTIIETGIDIPTANTIIIERADKLGLAQLHQLRGRVGRSHHQAYAYLLTPPGEALTEEARKRLEAVAAADQLGAGFLLATHDLEIRGAGELLGEEQSGHIEEIGFALYTSLLERAVAALRRGEEPDLEGETTRGAEIRLGIPALIPDDYLPDVAARLAFYRRLSASQSEEELRDIQVELIDRFGLLPPPVTYLVRATRLRQRAQRLGIVKLEGNAQGLAVEFGKEPRVDPLLVVRLVQEAPARYQLAGGNRLRVVAPLPDAERRLACAEQLVDTLASAPLKSTA